jgi:hypothetical protein
MLGPDVLLGNLSVPLARHLRDSYAGDKMHTSKTLISAVVLAAAVGVAMPASAQHHRDGGSGGNRGSDRGSERHAQAAPRSAPAQPSQQQQQPRADNRTRGDNGQRDGGQRAAEAQRPRDDNRSRAYAVPRSNESGRPGGVYRGDYSNRGYYNRGYSRSYGSSYRGYRSYAPIRFYRPYYSFRPRLSLGFGLWVGYPVPYYDPFYYPDYAYDYPYPPAAYPAYPPSVGVPQSAYPVAPYPQNGSVASAPQGGSISVQPSQTNTGGLSFDITPGEAEVVVDGNPVGSVDQFTPTSQPLGLSAGRHRVEIRAPGYQTITFDVNIVAGQVIPYQGSLER